MGFKNIRAIERDGEADYYRFLSVTENIIYSFGREYLPTPQWKKYIEKEIESFHTIEEKSAILLELSSKLPPEFSEGYTIWKSNYLRKLGDNTLQSSWGGEISWYPSVSYSIKPEDKEGLIELEDKEDWDVWRYSYRIICKGPIGTLPRDSEGKLDLPNLLYKDPEDQPFFDLDIKKGKYFTIIDSEDYNYKSIKDPNDLIDKELEVSQKESKFSLVIKVMKVNYKK